MVEELGKIEKPEAEQYRGKKKIYLVPLLFSWQDNPPDYTEKYNLYWQQVREHVANLESRIGAVKAIFHESLTSGGEEGLKTLERLNPSSYQLVREKCLMGARLESVEDRELIEEAMDWERHLMVGFISEKVARLVSQLFADASKRRYEYISQRIGETLQDEDVAMLVIREGHTVQFPNDVEVFMVAPPALDDIRRWLRDRQEKADREAAGSETEPPITEAKPE
jgi:hypothetical protein